MANPSTPTQTPAPSRGIAAEITLTTRAGRPTIWIEVTYDGTRPPRELFGDLALIGFDPPTEMPPPSSAMDWAVPDPTTRRPYTVRPHRIEATVEPPVGTGPKRSWTAGERAIYQRSLEGVLARHGLAGIAMGETRVIPGTEPLAALPPPPAAGNGAVAPHGATRGADTDETATEEHGTEEAEAEVVGFAMDGPSWHRVTIRVRAGDPGAVAQALRGAGMAARLVHRDEEVSQRFRGSVTTSTRRIVRVEALVDRAQLVVVEATLTAAGIEPDMIDTAVAPATTEDLTGLLRSSEGGDADTVAGRGRGSGATVGGPDHSTVTAVFDPKRRALVDEALDELMVTDREYAAASREIETRYRGSVSTAVVPGTRVAVRVDPAVVGAVVATISRVAGLDASDPRQVQVLAAEPVQVAGRSGGPQEGSRDGAAAGEPVLRLVG